jgi:trehalose-6-phosphate synthase
VLVLSDRAGAADELGEALLVNPYDIDAIASSLEHALAMPLAERRARFERLHRSVSARNVHAWWQSFLQALQLAREVSTDEPVARAELVDGRTGAQTLPSRPVG